MAGSVYNQTIRVIIENIMKGQQKVSDLKIMHLVNLVELILKKHGQGYSSLLSLNQ